MRRPSLRTVLLIVNLTVLVLPLGGIWVLRVYESTLVRQTESALIAQSAFIAASYRNALQDAFLANGAGSSTLHDLGIPIDLGSTIEKDDDTPWAFRSAQLDLTRDVVLPRPPDGMQTEKRADPIARAVGHTLTPVLNEAQRTTLAAMRIVDRHGIVIASTGEDIALSLAHLQEVERALKGDMVSTLRRRISDEPNPPLTSMSRGANIRVFVAMPVVHLGRVLGAVMLSRTPIDISKAIYNQRGLLLTSGLLLVAVVLAMSLFTAFTIRRPIAALIEQSRRAVRGERGAVTPLNAPVTEDIAELSEAVAHMANTLEERANYIQESMHHISHEFKTPLSSILGSIELMQDHHESMSNEQRLRFLNNLEEDARRLERLLRTYLDLATAEAIRPSGGETNLIDALQKSIDDHQSTGMEIHFTSPQTTLMVAINRELLDTIIANVLENALRHAGAQCHVDIVVDDFEVNDCRHVRIHIADDGPGISEGNQGKIFEPFFTTARKTGGTGLGLALVQSLLKAYQGTIELTPSAVGTTFVITLPIVPEL